MLNWPFARRRREELGLTQERVAELCGVGQDVVSRWESGQREPRDLASVRRYAAALQVEVGELVAEPEPEVAATP
jgi:transcriptional regulator with XRE-family HTH domain